MAKAKSRVRVRVKVLIRVRWLELLFQQLPSDPADRRVVVIHYRGVVVTETLFENRRTRVSRLGEAGAPDSVIRKEYLGPSATRRARRERAILERLVDVPGVPRVLPQPGPAPVLVTPDLGGRCLSQLLRLGRLSLDETLRIALELVAIIAAVHEHGIAHKDINPANILLYGVEQHPMLLDFDLAGAVVEEGITTIHQSHVVGTLAYIAPEQTGRTGWPIDHRADLYAFGATLYEMLVGQPPFGDSDPLRVTRDHLTRTPVAPHATNPTLPLPLSAIIMRLLQKEPDQRYQSAEGLQHDLRVFFEGVRRGVHGPVVLGERDFPRRLSPPARLIGRYQETQRLIAEFDAASAGLSRGVLVSGQPGVGKTALVNALRPVALAARGWFLSGKFDQYRAAGGSDALRQILRMVALMLLAEDESDLSAIRVRLRQVLADNVGLVAAVEPLYQPLLQATPSTDIADPATLQIRVQQICLEVLGAIAGPERPVVLLIDDIQWADPVSIGFIDTVFQAGQLHGVLLLGAYRESEVHSTHPLLPVLERWRNLSNGPLELRLENLPPTDLRALVGEMLHLEPEAVTSLADFVATSTDGNPFGALELLNTLRRERGLLLSEQGWTWDPVTLTRYIGPADVVGRLAQRIEALPTSSRELLSVLACLGGEVELDLLRVAVGWCGSETESTGSAFWGDLRIGEHDLELDDPVRRHLLPALEDGLVALEHEPVPAVRFRHDWIQQAAYRITVEPQHDQLRLLLARRLAAVARYGVVAAEQYLPVADQNFTGAERATVVRLLRTAADHARLLANYDLVDRYLAATQRLLDTDPDPAADAPSLRLALTMERHAACYALGRFDEVDRLYQVISEVQDEPLLLAQAAWVQISSLTNRGCPQDGLALGLAVLGKLGYELPEPHRLGADLELGLDEMTEWVANSTLEEDLNRPPVEDQRLLAAGRIFNRMIPAAYFSRSPAFGWMVTQAFRLWAAAGPARTLVGPLGHAALVTIAERGDYDTGYQVVRRVLEVGQARGYEPDTSEARFLYAVSLGPWFDPLEESVRQGQLAREGLVRGGDVQFGGFTYYASATQFMDCAATLEEAMAEVEAGLLFAERTGNGFLAASLVAYRQAIRALRGETLTLGGPNDATFDEDSYLDGLADNPTAAAFYHVVRGMVATIFNDHGERLRAVTALDPLLPLLESLHCRTTAEVVSALAAAETARQGTGGSDLAPQLARIDQHLAWLENREGHVSGGFRHLRCLLLAERAWVLNADMNCLRFFDEALQAVAAYCRPWHQALIVERTARFHLEHGVERSGRSELREAERIYQDWGANGKVAQLRQEFPFLKATEGNRPSSESHHSDNVSSDTVDMLAVLEASQALSSETNLNPLRERIAEILTALTGATQVRVLLRDPDTGQWRLPDPEGSREITAVEAGARGLIPLTVVNYTERTREHLLVEDAVHDERFGRDPYLAGRLTCSVMAVPITSRGELRAMLLLENHNSRSAFGGNRLDTVLLISGQLAVSLDNAVLYAELESKVAARTRKLEEVNDQLELLAITDPLTGLANRRHLMRVLSDSWRAAARSSTAVGIAMIDIDHFKLYNDNYGHPAGDRCLRQVAAAIGRNIRDTDLLARYGGEEFAIVLPGATGVVCRNVAERVRASVAELAEPHLATVSGIVTISVGVASAVPGYHTTIAKIIKAADVALYNAKQGGRDQVCSGVLA